MSHFGRSGPPDITDTHALLVFNITFGMIADDLFPLFVKCEGRRCLHSQRSKKLKDKLDVCG